MLVPGHERMEKELQQIREKIAGSDKPEDEDLKKLGALEAVKNAESDEDDEKGHLTIVADGIIAGYACMERDPGGTFLWMRSGDSWDLLKHDDGVAVEIIQVEYFRKYGVMVADYHVGVTLTTHRLRARSEGLRTDRVWRRAGFDGHTLWVDLGGRPRHLYGVSAKKHGPAVPYSTDVRMILERHGGAMPAPEYKEGRWLEAFCAMLRIPDRQYSLFCTHLCHMFCTHHETPAMLFCGQPGSGKTMSARLVRELVDPVGLEHSVAVLPRSADSLRGILTETPVASFDNVRQITQEAADALSGALEGLVMPADKQKHSVSTGNIRLILTAPTNMPKRLHSLSGRIVRYELTPVEGWKTMSEMAAEFYSMRPYLYHEMFDVLHRAFGNSQTVRPLTRMADFEVLGRSIAGHAGYDADGFAESLRSALDGTASGAS